MRIGTLFGYDGELPAGAVFAVSDQQGTLGNVTLAQLLAYLAGGDET